ncbi:hypothetical protein MKW94_007465 [Papaver nudicaule]|uniref:Uncharacterized protein n=1 Tax=Papaver nudicaule TaxID=74823 RepID=A0AA41SE40_PAPNU|nr:hypothetical protein [Papaver nudicaule]
MQPIIERLKYLRHERELMEKLSRIYIPEVEDIRSIMVAELHEKMIAHALLRLEVQWDELTSDWVNNVSQHSPEIIKVTIQDELTSDWVNNVSQHSPESIKIPSEDMEDIENIEIMSMDSVNSKLIKDKLGKGKVVESVDDPEAEKDNLASEVAHEGRA